MGWIVRPSDRSRGNPTPPTLALLFAISLLFIPAAPMFVAGWLVSPAVIEQFSDPLRFILCLGALFGSFATGVGMFALAFLPVQWLAERRLKRC